LFWRALAIAAAVALHAAASYAQAPTAITPTPGAGNLGTQVTQVGNVHDITGGTRSGTNLFHSFGFFSVGSGDVANFNNTAGLPTSNILGRVTGGQPSNIFGTIQTTNFPGTNLFLLNPAGWVFGAGATLNVSGSFHVSTADYIRFADGNTFCTNACPNGQANVLSVAEPAAFGFLGPSAGPISVQQSFLQVPEGKTLSIVGGALQIADFSSLAAPGGQVQIGSFASAGEATVGGLDGDFASLGPITISNASIAATGTASVDAGGNVSGVNGGTVLIRGGLINISGAFIDASGGVTEDPNTFTPVGTAAGTVLIRGGELVVTGSSISANTVGNGAELAIGLEATGDIVLAGGTGLTVIALGGTAGDVRITAGALHMQEFAFIDSIAVGGGGRGADVFVDVGRLTLEGGARISSQSAGSIAPADPGGDITVTATDPADSILITGEGSGIVSFSLAFESTGTGGAMMVAAPSLKIENGGTISTIASGVAPGGDVTISVGDLSVTGGGTVASRTFIGPGGDLTVNATGSVTISGAGSSILSGGSLGGSGVAPAGTIMVNTGTLTVTDFGVIQNGTLLDAAGDVVVTATDSIVISNGGKILSQAFAEFGVTVGDLIIFAPSVIMDNGLIQASTIQAGNAGDITMLVGALSLTNGAQVVTNSASSATGAGGNLTLIATDSVSISGSSSGLFSTAEGLGPAGRIDVLTLVLTMADGGSISVATSSPFIAGIGGNILVTAEQVTLSGGARVDSSTTGAGHGGSVTVFADAMFVQGAGTGLFSTATNAGAAGEIIVSAPMLNMGGGAQISVATSGPGPAGSIGLDVGTFSLSGGARVDSSTSSAGLGGNVTVNAAGSVSISGLATGLFSTAESTGNAGQIVVSAPTFTMSEGGQISVATASVGRAGDVGLHVSNFTLTGGARVDSSTTGAGLGGNVTIDAAGPVSIAGPGTGLFSTATGTGDAGQIAVMAPTTSLTDQAQISVATKGTTSDAGSAGNIALTATNGTVSVTGAARIDSSTTGTGLGGSIIVTAADTLSITGPGSGLFSTAADVGNAGQITVSAPTVTMDAGGTISVATSGPGQAGNIVFNATTFGLAGGAHVDSSTSAGGLGGNVTLNAGSVSIAGAGTGLFSTATSTGNAGQIAVSASNISLTDQGEISVATSSAGRAGDVALNVSNFTLASGARVDSSTSGAGEGGTVTINAAGGLVTISGGAGLFSTADGSGPGGDINIQAAELQLLTEGTISAKSSGTVDALAGNVNLVIGDRLVMDGGIITTDAAVADGGNISITTTGSLVHLIDSQITTSVRSGVGGGGNITIGSTDHPLDFVVFNNSQIRADAFGGPGGNIDIFANVYLTSDSVVSASSTLGVPGTIEIQATVTDVSGSVTRLPEAVLQAATLLRASCAARLAEGKASSLVQAGRDGLPLEPSGLLPSPLLSAGPAGAPASRSEEHWWEMVPRSAWSVLDPQCSR
jgi:filamentous hemagglutinin family protein